jgi:hypothetical protein
MHEPLVTREIFAAASTVGRFRQGSRSGAGRNSHPKTKRTYLVRSYVRCDLCGRRANGETTKGCTYYRYSPNAKNHDHLPWFPGHPRAALAAEGQLIEPLARFFAERVFGASRESYLAALAVGAEAAVSSDLAARRVEITDIYDALHLDLRYNCLRKDLTIRVTITADTAPAIAATVETITTERQKTKAGVQSRRSGPWQGSLGCCECAARDSNPEPAD